MSELDPHSSNPGEDDLDQRSAFQSLLGSKLGALACELIDNHHNAIVVQQREELEQLHSEAEELRRKLAKLEDEGDFARSEKLNSGVENVDIEVGLAVENVDFDMNGVQADPIAKIVDIDLNGAEGDPIASEQSPVSNRLLEQCISLGNTLSSHDPAAGSPASSDGLTGTTRLHGQNGTSVSGEKLKVKDCVDQRFQIHCDPQHHASFRDPENYFGSTAEQIDVMHFFRQLDPTGQGYIDIEEIIEVCHEAVKEDYSDEAQMKKDMDSHRSALYRLNRVLGTLAHEPHAKKGATHLNLASFKMLMLADPQDLEDLLHDEELVSSLLHIRAFMVNSSVISAVARAMNVSQVAVTTWKARRRVWIEKYLDPIVAVMIILNSLMIGISVDTYPGWQGWQYFEAYFTVFLVVELTLCLCTYGPREHFLGKDWAWNFFDLVLVTFAVIDTTWTSLSKLFGSVQSIDLNKITLLRLARLARVTRIVRLIRLGMFKELALMINGVIAGFRTLLWAMVLLSVLVYNLGVVMRELMDIQGILSDCKDTAMLKGKVFNVVNGRAESESTSCNRGDFVLAEYGGTLFGNVGRSMLTVFNCFTDGCDLPNGTPLIWYLWDTHGALMVLCYVVSYLFVCFGVFNLVAAVFVENTLARAHQRRQERHFLEAGHIAHAHHLHHLLNKICRERYDGGKSCEVKSTCDTSKTGCMAYLKVQLGSPDVTSFAKSDAFASTHLQMRVSQAMFDELLKDPSVQQILDELEISAASREQLFCILDSDGNGYLAISELVEGLMRLRGPSDKGDSVSTELMVRALQWQIRKFEAYVLANQQQLKAVTQDLQVMLRHMHGNAEDLAGPVPPNVKMSL